VTGSVLDESPFDGPHRSLASGRVFVELREVAADKGEAARLRDYADRAADIKVAIDAAAAALQQRSENKQRELAARARDWRDQEL
jgi:hypothetical protein